VGEKDSTLWDESGAASLRAPAADGSLAAGQLVLGKYRVGRLLGRGGMGSVYRATNERIRREFAIKLVNADVLDDISVARFRREAEAIAAVRHPNVVDIVDWETLPDGRPILVMEYVEGSSLRDRIEEGPMSFADILAIAGQLLEGLAAAHAAGITHRDLKPDNLMIARLAGGREVLKILDFGLARVEKSATLTESHNSLIGTPSYMSPEQIEGKLAHIGPATDMWAVGTLLYEMATGTRAFAGENITSTLLRVIEGEPTPISELRPDAPPPFCRLVQRLLTNGESRLSSATLAGQLLADSLSGKPGARASDLSGVLDSFADRRAPRRSALRIAGLVAGALLGVSLGVAGFWLSRDSSRDRGAEPSAAAVAGDGVGERAAAAAGVAASEAELPAVAEPEPAEVASEAEPAEVVSRARRKSRAARGKNKTSKAAAEAAADRDKESKSSRQFGDPLNPYR